MDNSYVAFMPHVMYSAFMKEETVQVRIYKSDKEELQREVDLRVTTMAQVVHERMRYVKGK